MADNRIGELREKAAKARQLAKYSAGDDRLTLNLESYAKELEAEALKLRDSDGTSLSPQATETTHEPPTTESMAAQKTQEPKELDD